MAVFDRIKELTKKHSKTMKQVTLDLNYSENYFYTLKNGKQPSAEKLSEIADYFGVSVDYLLGRTNDPNLHSGGIESEDDYEQELIMMFRKGEEEVAPEKRDLYRKQTKDLMSFISQTMKDLDEEND